MQKKLMLALLLLIVAIFLCGCSGTMSRKENIKDDRSFVLLERYDQYGDVIVDTETNVMYWVSEGGHTYGIMTLLVNPDGTPKIWTGE